MPKETFRIDILGTSFTISADEDPLYVSVLLSRYHTMIDTVERTTGVKDPLKIAIIAGIMLCDEIEKSHKKSNYSPQNQETKRAEQIILSLIERIDIALESSHASSVSS